MIDEEAIKKILMDEDNEFRKLITEHQLCEEKLKSLDGKKFLTEEEKREIVEIKKRKLGLKDQIYNKIRLYKETKI